MSDTSSSGSPPTTHDRRATLEAALADQAHRWHIGAPVPVETYLEREPQLRADVEAVLDLIYKEVLLRTERGEKPELAEYAARFPNLADTLRPIFEVHQALESNTDFDTGITQGEKTLRVPASSPPAPPPEVPGFELLDRLGHGGMGVVYKARQKSLDRTVALKMVLAGAHASAEQLARFNHEAEAVARLLHPNIVQIHEVGEHGGRPYLCLEFVEGGGLDKKTRGVPQPAREAAALVETLARAVHHAHLQDVVHRDLKPANVLLTANGTPKIADFGLARLGAGSGQTQTGEILGTPSYMAPEQAAGRTSAIGPAADVYALGAILYELLTGRPPFLADHPIETLRQVLEQEPLPPTRLQPSVPRDLETVCLKCLQKAPHKRYASAEALADDLRRFLDGWPILARPTPFWERAIKWTRRRPALASLAAVIAAAVVAVVLYNFWLQAALTDANDQRSAAQNARTAAEEALEERRRQLVQVLLADGTRLLEEGDWFGALLPYAQAYSLDQKDSARAAMHQMRLTSLLRQCPRLVQFWPHSATVSHAAFTADSRRALIVAGNSARLVDVVTGADVAPASVHGQEITAAVLSADGRRMATAADDRSVQVWEADTGKRIGAPMQCTDAINRIAIIGDGDRLVIATRGLAPEVRLQIWDVAESKAVSSPLVAPMGAVSEVSFSADGKLAATANLTFGLLGANATLTVWDVASAKKLSESPGLPAAITKTLFSPTGDRVAAATLDGMARVFNCASGKQTSYVRQDAPVLHLAFSADGRRFATAGLDGTARTWESDVSKWISTLKHGRQFTHAVQAVAFSPDGIHAVTAGADNTARIWNLTTGTAVGPPLRHPDKVSQASFSKDGRLVLTTSRDQVRIWDLASRRLAVGPLEHEEDVVHAAFDKSGNKALTASDDRTARMWDATTGRPIGAPMAHTHPVVFAGFAADGRVITTGEHNPEGEGEACVWDATAGTLAFRRPAAQRIKGAPDMDRTARRSWFSPDGRWLVAMDGAGKAQVCDTRTGQKSTKVLQHGSGVTAASFSTDGRHVLTATFLPDFAIRSLSVSGQPPDALMRQVQLMKPDKTVSIWDASEGKRLATIGPWSDTDAISFRRASFGPEYGAKNKVLLLVSDSEARLWDVAENKAIRRFRKPGAAVVGAALSPDGRVVATTSDDESAQLWDSATGELMPTQLAPSSAQFWYAGQSWPPLFSPDGRILALGGIGGVRVWDLVTGNPVAPTLEHPGQVKSAAFSADGRRLLTACDRAARVWDLSAGDRSADAWLRLAQFLSCSSTHPQAGRPVAAGSDQPRALWEELVRHSPGDFKSTETDAVIWHREVARAFERAQQWQAAQFHWTALIERDPSRSDFYDRRGRARAELGQWKEAAADFEKATKVGADRPEPWHRRALVRLHLGDVEGYRQACAAMLDQLTVSKDVGVIQVLAWTCTLATSSESARARLLKASETTLANSPPNHARLLTLGAALFRAGRHQDAIVKLNDAAKLSEAGARDWLFLAMAYHHTDQSEHAKSNLDRASRWIDQAMTKAPGSASDNSKLSWSRRLELTLLQREAAGLLRGESP